MNKKTRIHRFESASVSVKHVNAGRYRLANLYSVVPNQGHATALLNEIIEWAEAEHIDLELNARPYRVGEGHKPDVKSLILFYNKFGFEVESTDPKIFMVRVSKGKKCLEGKQKGLKS